MGNVYVDSEPTTGTKQFFEGLSNLY